MEINGNILYLTFTKLAASGLAKLSVLGWFIRYPSASDWLDKKVRKVNDK